MKNGQRNQAYVQGFDFETITLEKAVNMFELMEIAETIYEDVVEKSKTNTRADTNHVGLSKKNEGISFLIKELLWDNQPHWKPQAKACR